MSDNITLPRKVAKLALDHIEWYIENERGGRFAEVREAAEALRTALAAPEPEPVARPWWCACKEIDAAMEDKT